MLAQPAAVADAAARPRDRAFFDIQNHTTVIPVYRCGAAKRHTVGRLSLIPLSRSSRLVYGAVAQERHAAAMEPIERGMQICTAGRDTNHRFLNPDADEGPLC